MPISSGQITVGTTRVQVDGTSSSVYRLHIHNERQPDAIFILVGLM
jgi:hypothetical protein